LPCKNRKREFKKDEYSRIFKKMRANREAITCNWNDMEDVGGKYKERMRQGLRQDEVGIRTG
jgi:hypothetical protein